MTQTARTLQLQHTHKPRPHAQKTQLESVEHPIHLCEINDPVVFNLPRRAGRLFAVAGALIKMGYGGTLETHGELCHHVRRLTKEKFGLSTCKAAVKELQVAGLVDVRTTYNSGRMRQLERGRCKGRIVREQRTQITFTALAIDIVSRPKKTKAYIVSRETTPDHMRLHSQKVTGHKLPSNPELLTPVLLSFPVVKNSGYTAREGARSSSLSASVGSSVPSQAEHDRTAVEPGTCIEASTPRANSARPPALHAGNTRPTTRQKGAAVLLATLVHVAQSYKQAGQRAVTQAAHELADPRHDNASGIDWDFWIATWGRLTQNEQRKTARREILQRLLPPRPVLVASLSALLPVAPVLRSDVKTGERGNLTETAAPAPVPQTGDLEQMWIDMHREQAAKGVQFSIEWLKKKGI